jgi:hypothetical protein
MIFNAEIKIFQQYNIQKIYSDIFGLTMTLEKPTRRELVREGIFIICEVQRNFFYNIFIFRNYTNLSQNFFNKTPSEQS